MNPISEFWKRWVHGKRAVKNKTALDVSNEAGGVQKNKNLEMRDQIKNLLTVEPRATHEEPVIYRFVGISNILEMLAYIELWNKSGYAVTVQKITWDFWIEGLHVKYGTYADKLFLGAKTPSRQLICLHEVLLDSQTSDVLWASQKAKTTGYLEGEIYCETAYGRFQKKFNLLKLSFSVSGETKEKPKDMMGEAYLDGLTGLLQRRFLDDNLQTIIDRNIHRAPISFAMVDIDNFKKINDECGHLAGDEVLKAVCSEIKDTLHDRGIAIRYGGDEVAVVLPSCNIDEAQAILEIIRSKIEKYDFKMQEGIVRATVSIGIATLTEQANYKILIRIADNMLRFSKQNGKNRVSVNLRKIEPEG